MSVVKIKDAADKSVIVGVAPGEKPDTPKKKKKGARRASKEAIRRTLLSRLPKGGLAIEIGVWHGDFSSTILELIQPDQLFLIDPWAHIVEDSHTEAFVGRTGSDKMDRIFDKVRKKFEAEIASGKVSIIRDFSVPALEQFEEESIAFAYIDGDHSYEGVSSDLKALFPKMKIGGVMAFDDYHRKGWWGDAVIRAIHEFIGEYPTQTRVRALAGAQIAIEKIGEGTD